MCALYDPSGDDGHLIALDQGWSLWRWVALRGAGFPASLLSAIAAPVAVAASDRLVVQEDAVAAARSRAVVALQAQLQGTEGDARKPITRALKKLNQHQSPDPAEHRDEARSALEVLRSATTALDEERAAAARIYEGEQRRISEALRTAVADPRFHEAVLWQNRAAFHGGFAWLLRQQADDASSKTRKIEAAVASYLQRYCTKNETIGFFGPLGWATLERTDDRASLRAGEQFLSKRSVYFEHWAIIEIADLIRGVSIRQQIAPRRNPAVRAPAKLPGDVARILGDCDGVRTAREIARALVSDPQHDFEDELDVYALLDELEQKGLVIWGLEIPFDAEAPERALRDLLAPLTGELRDQTLALLDELEAARARVAAAAGDVAALDTALGEVNATFEKATGVGATRRHGQNYAGRTLLFEDCERDLELRLGPSFTASFAAPLALVLESVRWLSFRLAGHLRGELQRAFDELRAETGSTTIEFRRVFDRIPGLADGLKSSDRDVTGELLGELASQWRDILGLAEHEGQGSVRRSSTELAAKVHAAFAVPQPGWPGARHHSVDIMVAARSFAELERGRGLAVLGEVHPCGVHLAAPVFVRACSWREEIFRAYRRGTASAQVAVPPSKRFASRTACGPRNPADLMLDVGMRSTCPPSRMLAPSELVVESTPEGLVVRTLDGRARLDAVVFCAAWLKDAADRFALLSPARHVPRVTVDNLVVQRQTWRMPPEEVGFAQLERGIQQFSAARCWARERGIPRWSFIKIPEELKPVFVDFESPISVEMLAKLVRGASSVTLSEMLPALDELWLPDGAGNLYTSELRLTAVDPIPWSA